MNIKKIILFLLFSFLSLNVFAVTDKEMDQAKTIAAKLYLRWANNGSGYLDDISVNSMSELESKLKAKEKENLKVFNSVSIPKDYASWDKAKLVEFWGATFFSSPALNPEGKKAKDRVRRQVQALNIAVPQKQEAKAEPEKTSSDSKPESPKSDVAVAETEAAAPSAEQAIDEQETLLADQEAISKDLEDSRNAGPKEKSNTWVYIVILVILVGVVVWLMVYAANMMKKQAPVVESESSKEDKNEIKKLHSKINALSAELEESRNKESLLTKELNRLKQELAESRQKEIKPEPEQKNQKEQTVTKPDILTEIYLGRVNPRKQFVRGDRRPTPGHTVFRLDTKDGKVGTFRIAEHPDTTELALSNPFLYLAGGCDSDNFEDAEQAKRIVTETPGTAIFEDGCWKVLRKSRIKFE